MLRATSRGAGSTTRARSSKTRCTPTKLVLYDGVMLPASMWDIGQVRFYSIRRVHLRAQLSQFGVLLSTAGCGPFYFDVSCRSRQRVSEFSNDRPRAKALDARRVRFADRSGGVLAQSHDPGRSLVKA